MVALLFQSPSMRDVSLTIKKEVLDGFFIGTTPLTVGFLSASFLHHVLAAPPVVASGELSYYGSVLP